MTDTLFLKNGAASLNDDELLAMMSSVYNEDSDALATALPYARAYGVSLDFAKKHEKPLAANYATERAQRDLEEFRKSPYLRKYIEEPDNYRLIKDDSASLTAISDYMRSAPAGLVKGFGAGIEGAGYGGEAISTYGLKTKDPLLLLYGTSLQAGGPLFKKAGRSIQEAGEFIAPPEERQSSGTRIVEGLGQIGGQVAATAYNPALGAGLMFSQGMAQQGRRAEEAGATPEQEADAVLLGGLTTFATERIPVGMILNKTGLDDVLKAKGPQAVKTLAEKYLKSPAAKKIFDIGGTGLAEGTQEYVENIIQNVIAKGIYDPEAALIPQGTGLQSAEAGASAAILRTIVLGMMGIKGASVQADIQDIGKTQNTFIKNVTASAKSGNLINRSPEELAKIVQGMADDAQAGTVYVPAQAVQEFFQPRDGAAAPDFERFSAFVPEVSGLEDALAHGGDIAINTGNIVAALAADEQFAGLADHIRMLPEFDPDAYDLRDIDTGDLEEVNLGLTEGEQVFNRVYEQFVNSGETPDSARLQAGLVREYYQTLSARYGDNEETQRRLDELTTMLSVQREIDKKVRSSLETQYGSLFEAVRRAQDYFQKQEAQAKESTSLFGKIQRKKKEAGRPEPILAWIKARGGILPDSGFAKELSTMDITPKTRPGLFRKKSGGGRFSIEGKNDFDAIPASEFNAAFDGIVSAQEDGNGYVDERWLLDAIRDESFGNSPALPLEVRSRDMEIRNFEALRNELERAGIGLSETDPAAIVKAIVPDAEVPEITLNHPLNVGVDPEREIMIVQIDGKFKNWKELKQDLKTLRGQKIPTADVNRFMKILPKNISHIIYSGVPARYRTQEGDRNRAINNIEALISQAVLVESSPNTKTKTKKNIQAYHRFYVPVRIGKETRVVRLVAEQTKKGLQYAPEIFDLYDVIIETPSAVSAPKGGQSGQRTPHMAEGDRISIRQMLSGVKDNAGKSYFQSATTLKTDTPEFKKWFGDSKVVDEDGKPLVVYHGTNKNIETFDNNKIGSNVDAGWLGKGHYFSDSPGVASGYAGIKRDRPWELVGDGDNVYPVYLHIKKPYKLSFSEMNSLKGRIAKGGDAASLDFTDSLIKQGYDGVVADTSTPFGGKSAEYVVFRPEQIKSIHNRGTFDPNDARILYQADQTPADPRGRIELYASGKAVLTLMQSANRSTALHELAHWFSFVNQELAKIDPRAAAEWEAARNWLGVKEGESLTTEQEETFARGFEAWLGEGNAPSAELDNIFRRFKAWILRAYRLAVRNLGGLEKALNVKLNDDIRDYFSRMLATDEQIEAMKGRTEYAANEAVLEMLTEPQKKRYLDTVSRESEEAKDRLLRKALRQKEQETKKFYKEERAKLKEQITAQVNTSPLYRAMNFLKTGTFLPGDAAAPPAPFKIDTAAVKRMIPEQAGKLKDMTTENGIHPDMAAELFGFATGTEMLRVIVKAENRQKLINRLTDEEMKARHGDMLTDGTMEREALEAFENDWAQKRMEIEGKAAAREAKIPFPRGADFKREAGRRIDDKTVTDAQQSMRFHLAMRRAAREYGKAIGEKNWIKAAEWKQRQLLAHFLYKESLAARNFVDKHIEDWSRLRRKDEVLAKGNDLNYVTIARALLSRAGVMRFRQDTEQYIRNIEADDPEAAADIRRMIDENMPAPKDWKTMSYGEFRALADTVDSVIELGRKTKSVMIDGERILLDTISQELRAKLEELPDSGIKEGLEKGRYDDFKNRLAGFDALKRRTESWVKFADNGYAGPWRKYIWNIIDDARGQYLTARAEMFGKIRDVLAPHADRINNSGKIMAPEIGKVFPSKAQLIGALLHTGNDSNFDKLLRGYNWPAANWDAMIDRMQKDGTLTKEDYELVQAIWDIAESMKRPAWKAHKEMYGFYPEEVEPIEVVTPFGNFRGGYWPAVADPSQSEDAAIRQEREDLLSENNSFMFPSTGRGFTKGRDQKYAAPLALELSLLTQHVDKVLRFTHIQPAVRTAGRILRRRDVRNELRRINPMIARNMLIPWLQRVAQQSVEAKGHTQHAILNDAARWLRNTSSMQTMMLNISNALQQPTGALNAMHAVGKRNFAKAFMRYAANPLKASAEIHELSVFMRYRQSVLADEVRQEVYDVIKNRSNVQKVADMARRQGYIFQRIFQHMIDVPTWMAAYDRAISGKVEGIAADDLKNAVRHADSVVRETQGSSSPEDVSAVEAGTAMGRLFTLFFGYFNMVNNYVDTENALIKRSNSNVRGRQFYLYLMAVAMPAMLADIVSRAMRGDLPDDDDEDGYALDDWLAFLAMSPVRAQAAMIPYAGQVFNAILGQFNERPYDDRITVSPVVSTLDKAIRGPVELYKAITEGDDLSRAVNDTMTTLGVATGLPLGQLGKPAGYVADVAEGDVTIDNPVQPLRGLLGGPIPATRQ